MISNGSFSNLSARGVFTRKALTMSTVSTSLAMQPYKVLKKPEKSAWEILNYTHFMFNIGRWMNKYVFSGILCLIVGIIFFAIRPFNYFESTVYVFGNQISGERPELKKGETKWLIRNLPSGVVVKGAITQVARGGALLSVLIDFIVLDSSNFEQFVKDSNGNYSCVLRYQNITSTEYQFTTLKTDTYYFVLKNVDTQFDSDFIDINGYYANPITYLHDSIIGMSFVVFGLFLLLPSILRIRSFDLYEGTLPQRIIVLVLEASLGFLISLLLIYLLTGRIGI